MDEVEDLRSATCSQGAPSARNLIVTIFGDVIAPRSIEMAVSVRSLADLLEPFAANERLVRTSLSRLVHDEVLAVTTHGRRSFYGVAAGSQPMFKEADDRIYGPLHGEWDGQWTFVLIDGFDATPQVRADLRNHLLDRGFGVSGSNILASALAQPSDIADLFVDDHLGRVMVMRAAVADVPGCIDSLVLARHVHRLDDLRRDYRTFTDRFGSYRVEVAGGLDPADAFKLRLLLVASYRRIVLGDAGLPLDLLPDTWAGCEARQIIAELYAAVSESSESFLETHLVTSKGATDESTDRPMSLAKRFYLGGHRQR